jgi:hypothetical protein
VNRKTLKTSDFKFLAADGRKLPWRRSLSEKETFPPATRRTSDENVMIPNPPSWIMVMMISCPVPLNDVAVSTATRPVTHRAEVDVKRASMYGMRPDRALDGSESRRLPARMAAEKLMASIWAGWKNLFFPTFGFLL